MADEPAYIRNFKEFTKGPLTFADLAAFEAEAYAGTDRSLAIMLSSVTENALYKYVRFKMRQDLNSDDRSRLFGFDGIVGSFGSKTLMAHACAWIQADTRADLDLIRIIRNGFAHSTKAFDFETVEGEAICAKLTASDDDSVPIPHGYLSGVPRERLEAAGNLKHPRTRFVKACHVVAERLLAAASPGEYDGIRAP